MSLGRVETAVRPTTPYLDHAHFFATKDAVACFSFDAVALRVSPPTRIIAAATRKRSTPPPRTPPRTPPTPRRASGRTTPWTLTRRLRRAIHARVRVRGSPRGRALGRREPSDWGVGRRFDLASVVVRRRRRRRLGEALPGRAEVPQPQGQRALGGGVGHPAVAPVVDGPTPCPRSVAPQARVGCGEPRRILRPFSQRTAVTRTPAPPDALRKATLEDGDEVHAASLASVAKWDGGAKGGKSVVRETRDDRFIVNNSVAGNNAAPRRFRPGVLQARARVARSFERFHVSREDPRG